MKESFYYTILFYLKLIRFKKLSKYLNLIYIIPLIIVLIDIFDNVYILSLLNSLSFQIVIAMLFFTIFLMAIKKYKLGLVNFASAIYLLLSISVFDNNYNYDIELSENNISVSHFNVLRTNKNYDTIINSAKNSGSDIISFQEISSDWKDKLITLLSDEYPYYIIKERDNDYFGIALFSKYKIENERIVYIENLPNIFATINKDNLFIDVVTSHTNSPISKERFLKRNKHIDELIIPI